MTTAAVLQLQHFKKLAKHVGMVALLVEVHYEKFTKRSSIEPIRKSPKFTVNLIKPCFGEIEIRRGKREIKR